MPGITAQMKNKYCVKFSLGLLTFILFSNLTTNTALPQQSTPLKMLDSCSQTSLKHNSFSLILLAQNCTRYAVYHPGRAAISSFYVRDYSSISNALRACRERASNDWRLDPSRCSSNDGLLIDQSGCEKRENCWAYHPGRGAVDSWSSTGSNNISLIQQCQYRANQFRMSSDACNVTCIERRN